MSILGKLTHPLPLALAAQAGPTCGQVGALCWRNGPAGVEVLLVTSRDTGRWIIPKGWPMKGRSPEDAALREAFEEAGVEGEANPVASGSYRYVKVVDPAHGAPCEVTVFPVRVARLRDRFPERGQRDRAWFTPEEAATKVDEAELRALLRLFAPDGAG